MSEATAALDAMIASTLSLGSLVSDAMPALAKAAQHSIERTIAAGTDAYDKPWQPTKEGKRPLRDAASALTVVVNGRTIYCQLKGVEARHHLGRVKGKRKRAILPDRGLPDTMAEDMRAVLARAFAEKVNP